MKLTEVLIRSNGPQWQQEQRQEKTFTAVAAGRTGGAADPFILDNSYSRHARNLGVSLDEYVVSVMIKRPGDVVRSTDGSCG